MDEESNEYVVKLQKEDFCSEREYWINMICQLPEFRKNNCILYENVCISDIKVEREEDSQNHIDKKVLKYVNQGATLDYMICLGDEVVAGIDFYQLKNLKKEEQVYKTYLKGLPVMKFTDSMKHRGRNISDGDCEIISNFLEIQIISQLEHLSKNTFLFSTIPIVSAIQQIEEKNIGFDDLEDKYLLKQNACVFAGSNKVNYPTEYGRESGIVKGYYTDEETGDVYFTLRCLSKAVEELKKINKWKKGEIDLNNEFLED